ncbi:hypothetical protein [Pantoea vagans]|uniref:hypothetical protein n=1 Tax=Pantoea vagans TaxID=470934 RepID=UPI0028E89314|nr:hypothetical protein [Pantoea vagans]
MKNALIVVAIQNDYFPGGACLREETHAACKAGVRAIEKAREAGWLIIGIQHVTFT